MVTQEWFKQAINSTEPVDMFLLLGHNAVRSSMGGTFGVIHDAIRQAHPRTPIQIFGGHTHIRDFAVLDESSTALESGLPRLLPRDISARYLTLALQAATVRHWAGYP